MNKIYHSIYLILITNFGLVSAYENPQIITEKIFERTPNGYAAFPNLYHDRNDGIVLTYQSRNKISHLDATGESFSFRSVDCGKTWKKMKHSPPPAVYFDINQNIYSFVGTPGWKKAVSVESVPLNTEYRVEDSHYFYSTGAINLVSSNEGKTWSKVAINTPAHSMLMIYNANAHLRTASKTYISAVYFKKNKTTADQVLIYRQANDKIFKNNTIPLVDKIENIGGNETALVQSNDGKIYAIIRANKTPEKGLYISESTDDGENWTVPTITPLKGFPASAIAKGNQLLVTTAIRSSPFSIVSYEYSPSKMEISKSYILYQEEGSRPNDFGYPTTLSCDDHFITSYYRPSKIGAEVVVISWKIKEDSVQP